LTEFAVYPAKQVNSARPCVWSYEFQSYVVEVCM
jgi:hypothetical protein